MAGSNAAFDADLFRRNIRATMLMGIPNTVTDRPTFRWLAENDYAKEDVAGQPYDWTSSPVDESVHEDVQVTVAVEFSRTTETAGSPLGNFDMSRAVLTMLEDEYDQVFDADLVLLSSNIYTIEFWEPTIALFSVDVHRCHVRARAES